MKYVVMVSHGEFAPGLHSAVKMMTGDREDVLSTSLKDGMSADEFASNFAELIKDFKEDDQVILLADILSGSPFTNALNVLDQRGLLQNTLVIAQSAADEVKNTAKQQADQIIREAEGTAKSSLDSINQSIILKQREKDEMEKQFDIYKAKMESLLISQLELIKDMKKDN